MNKRGWLRILEAFIGIVILVGVIVFIYSTNYNNTNSSDLITITQSKVLDKIELNDSLRLAALQDNLYILNEFAKQDIPPTLNFTILICDIDVEVGCKTDYKSTEVYVKDKIIVSNLTLYSPKKVRLFLWEK